MDVVCVASNAPKAPMVMLDDLSAGSRKQPPTMIAGKDVAVEGGDSEESSDAAADMVVERNKPAEIVRRAPEVGAFDADEVAEEWFNRMVQCGAQAEGNGAVVVELVLGESMVDTLPSMPAALVEELKVHKVDDGVTIVIILVGERRINQWPNGDTMPNTVLGATVAEYLPCKLMMSSIDMSLSVGERDCLTTTINRC